MKTLNYILLITISLIASSCVQETHLKTIKFQLDMRHVDSIINPGVRGQFTSPSWQETILLEDKNQDGIYEGEVSFQAAQYGVQFKFVNNDDYELEGGDNRFIKFEYKPETFSYKAVFDDTNHNLTTE